MASGQIKFINFVEKELIPYQDAKQFYLAFSGGLDSSVLLHVLSQIPHLKNKLRAIHIDHGWSKTAKQWSTFCQKVCDHYQIPLIIIKLPPMKISEETARQARYEIFQNLLKPNEILLMAHQRDDQAETVLMRLLRGSGIKGLSGMPQHRNLGEGLLVRPMFAISRNQIQQYAKKNKLKWIKDPSNDKLHFRRNFIRHKVLSLIQQQYPEILETLADTAQVLSEQNELLNATINQHLKHCEVDDAIQISEFNRLTNSEQKSVIVAWLNKNQIQIRSQQWLNNLINTLFKSKVDKNPQIDCEDVIIRRYQNRITLVPKIKSLPKKITWNLKKPLKIPGIGTLTATQTKNAGIEINPDEKITVQFWQQQGERFHPHNRAHSTKLKKLWQEWEVPVWQRQRIPLIYANEELIAVVGYAYAKSRAISHLQPNWLLQLI